MNDKRKIALAALMVEICKWECAKNNDEEMRRALSASLHAFSGTTSTFYVTLEDWKKNNPNFPLAPAPEIRLS